MRWYYSNKLKLYIDLDPLKLDKRIVDVSNKIGLTYDYDTEKNICNIDFDDSRKLLDGLGAQMLTLTQYWELYKEAIEDNNTELLKSLTSDYFTEPLDRIYISKNEYMDNPKIVSKYKYAKKNIKKHNEIEYRPGWFLPDNNIDFEIGLPQNINNQKNAKIAEWKFWTPDLSVTKQEACFVLRGYVTSVGRPSLDLGIPVDSKQPKQMIRECRIKSLESDIDTSFLNKIDAYLAENINIDDLMSDKNWHKFLLNEDNEINIKKEILFDKIGRNNLENSNSLNIINYFDFLKYIQQLKNTLAKNIDNKITFVIGHRNPDTDTVISSILEAYRNTLLYPKNIYIPIVQANSLPIEIRELLGEELSNSLICYNDENYQKVLEKELYSYIFVDHNYQNDAQKSVIKITDHHEPSDIAKLQRIPKTLELIGSTTALILIKFLGINYTFDKEMLTIIYGAMLMDTENKVAHKMTEIDKKVFEYIEKQIDINGDELYKKLSNKLISCTDFEILFNRDYKDFLNYGFAVIKTKDENIKKSIPQILNLAKLNNLKKSYPLTIIKIVVYNEDVDVLKEIILFEKKDNIPNQLIDDIKEIITKSLELSFKDIKFIDEEKTLTFYNIGKQLSRKKISSAIEKVVAEYDEFIYMKYINKWVARDFLKINDKVKNEFKDIKYNSNGYINYISYLETKNLIEFLDYEILTLSEYWQVLKEAKDIGDIRLERSLKHNKYIEFLNTTSKDFDNIPKGSPSLFFEGEVDFKTGLPNNLLTPNHYGLPNTWRYWSNPDGDNTYVFTRSHIFLLETPCLDAKTLDNESFPNLLIRPVSKKNPNPKLDININNKKLNILKLNNFTENYELIYEGSNFIV